MRVQFHPWRYCSVRLDGETDSRIASSGKRRRHEDVLSCGRTQPYDDEFQISLVRDPKEAKDSSEQALNRKQQRRQKRKHQMYDGFKPLICVTRPHSISVLGAPQKKGKDHTLSAAAGEQMIWHSALGKSHAFLPSSKDDGGSFARIPALTTSGGQWFVALQCNNERLVLRRLRSGGANEQSNGDEIVSLTLPDQRRAVSLFEVEAVDNIVAGILDNGSLFLVRLSDRDAINTMKIEIIHASRRKSPDSDNIASQRRKKVATREGDTPCNGGNMLGEEFLLNTLQLPLKTGGNVEILVTNWQKVNPQITESPIQLLTRKFSIPISKEGGTCKQPFISSLPSHIRHVDAICTLDAASGHVVVLCRPSSCPSRKNSYEVRPLKLHPSSRKPDGVFPFTLSSELSAKSLSIGCVSKHHVIAMSSIFGMRVYDIRFAHGAVVHQSACLGDIFRAVPKQVELYPVVLGYNALQNSVALGCASIDERGLQVEVAFSSLTIADGSEMSMADSLSASILASKLDPSYLLRTEPTDLLDETTLSIEKSATLKAHLSNGDKHSNMRDDPQSIFRAFLRDAESEPLGTAFEKALIHMTEITYVDDINEEQGGTASLSSPVSPADLVPEKAINNHSKKNHSNETKVNGTTKCLPIMNGGTHSKASTANPTDYRLWRQIPREFYSCAADYAIRALVTEYTTHCVNLKDSAASNDPNKSMLKKQERQLTSRYADSTEALQVLMLCFSLEKVSLNEVNRMIGLLTKFKFTSLLDFLCRLPQREPVNIFLIMCILKNNDVAVSERDLVLVAKYVLCSVSFNGICEFASQLGDTMWKNQMIQSDALQNFMTDWLSASSKESLLRRLTGLSKLYASVEESRKCSLRQQIIRCWSLFWVELISNKCRDGLNPNFLRGAISETAFANPSQPSVIEADTLMCIAVSFASFVEAVYLAKFAVSHQKQSKQVTASLEWINALADCYEIQRLRSRNGNRVEGQNLQTKPMALDAFQCMVKDALGACRDMVPINNLLSLTLLEDAKMAVEGSQEALGPGISRLGQYKRQRLEERAGAPPYSIERLQF